ncbi:uncharacterized protein LOC103516353 [Diaphorina citri]|uniref:Uncharacterized protein LOC103516353 n=1 Tax=Diaphorina citri TaxID=121845 RepID=A0A3Q0J7Y1_DIACI|nr:uncharacterized protein LOC103516353 [Diaphorina citri]
MRRSVSSVAIGNMNSFEGLSRDLRWQDGHVNVNINTIQTLSRNGVYAVNGKEVQRIDKTGLVFKPITKPAQTTVRHGPLSQGPSRPLQRCTSDVWGQRRKSSMQTMSPLQMALISPDIRIRIEDIRDWFALQDYIRDRLDDEMILAFLHTCYYNVKEVRKRIIEYFHARSCLPNMLDFGRDPQLLSDSVQPVLDHFYICPLVHATRNEIIIYVKCASPEPPPDHEYTGYHRLLFSITEQCVRDHPTRDGFTFVFDSGNFAFGHFKKAGFKMATQLFNYYQVMIMRPLLWPSGPEH